ncbi:MAG: FtsX-like permease family protein [candidate division WOR-3 bacterium]
MMFWIKFVLRNVWRVKIRTFIHISALAGGTFMAVWFHNVAFGNYENMLKFGIRMGSGYVSIYPKEYFEKGKLNSWVRVSKVKGILNDDLIYKAFYRVNIPAIIRTQKGSQPVMVLGLNFDNESDLPILKENSFVKGGIPSSENGAIISKELAENLGIDIGSAITIMYQDTSGNITGNVLVVEGIVKSGVDGNTIYANKDYLGFTENVHYVGIIPKSTRDIYALKKRLSKEVKGNYLVLTWQEAMPELYSAIILDYSGIVVMVVFMFIVISFGTVNLGFMNVLERVKEFGLMRAVGFKGRDILRIVMLEFLILGVIGISLGLLLAIVVNYLTYKYGLDVSSLLGSSEIEYGGVALEAKIKSIWDWRGIVGYPLLLLLMSVLSGYLPAKWASKVKVSEILRR